MRRVSESVKRESAELVEPLRFQSLVMYLDISVLLLLFVLSGGNLREGFETLESLGYSVE